MKYNRKSSRLVFFKFVFSNLFSDSNLEDVQNALKKIGEDHIADPKFLQQLYINFEKNKDQIYKLIEKYNNRKKNIDMIIFAVLLSATSELFLHDSKLVISEYLKICDIFNLNSSFINGVLDKISKEIKN